MAGVPHARMEVVLIWTHGTHHDKDTGQTVTVISQGRTGFKSCVKEGNRKCPPLLPPLTDREPKASPPHRLIMNVRGFWCGETRSPHVLYLAALT